MVWQLYKQVWDAEGALKAAVPTAWVKAGHVVYAVVKFPREAEPGERWAEKTWIAMPWVFGNGLYGVEVVFEDARFTAVACPQHGEGLAGVEKRVRASQLLNIRPSIHAVATRHVPRRNLTPAPVASA